MSNSLKKNNFSSKTIKTKQLLLQMTMTKYFIKNVYLHKPEAKHKN